MKRCTWAASRLRAAVLCALAGLGAASGAQAQMVVLDPANLVENSLARIDGALNLFEQYRHYEQMVKDYQQMLKDYEAITGRRGLSNLANGQFEQMFVRRHMPADWDALLYLRDAASVPDHLRRYKLALDRVGATWNLPQPYEAFNLGAVRPAGDNYTYYEQGLRISQSSMAMGMNANQLVDARLSSIEEMIAQADAVEGDENDLKRSIDLNTRVSAEVALLLAEMIRMQGLQAVSSGIQDQQRLRDHYTYVATGAVDSEH